MSPSATAPSRFGRSWNILHKLFSEFNLFMPLWTDAIYLQGRSLSDGTQPARQMISGDKANAANQAAENS
jgi:hypothetical protein